MTEEYHRSMIFSIHRFIMRLRYISIGNLKLYPFLFIVAIKNILQW